MAEPTVSFLHADDVPFTEVKSQQHGDRRVSVWIRFLVQREDRTIFHTRYDPGLILERHGHSSDHFVFVTKGDVMFGDEKCSAGSLIELPHGASFGPIIVGDQGAEIVELYFGNIRPVPADPPEYLRILAERGIERLPPPNLPPGADPSDRVDT
jgi:hypothetical protein